MVSIRETRTPSPGSHLRCDPTSPRKRGEVRLSTQCPGRLSSNAVPPRILPAISAEPAALLPDRFLQWFASRGWSPREHQLELLAKARDDRSALLIAPTGAGKTLAGFLPTLVELSSPPSSVRASPLPPRSGGEGRVGVSTRSRSQLAPKAPHYPPPNPSPPHASRAGGGEKSPPVADMAAERTSRPEMISTGRSVKRSGGLHTLYISPLKALAVDIARNLETPIAEMGLSIKVETRTGDTPVSRRQRQRRYRPDILLTTPEQLALLLSSDDAPFLFSSLKRIVLDELHALVTSKRGDLLALGLARLWRLAPEMRGIGLSATVAEPESLARFLVPQRDHKVESADIVVAGGAAAPVVEMLDTRERLPCRPQRAPRARRNVRVDQAQQDDAGVRQHPQPAEMLFETLAHERRWPRDRCITVRSDVAQRRRSRSAMAAGKLRGVVCTSSLDLGVDWGDVDLVINVGAPKGSSRLMQQIGRANHRIDEASRAVLVPANRFEVLECAVAIDAIAENAQDTPPLRTGALGRCWRSTCWAAPVVSRFSPTNSMRRC